MKIECEVREWCSEVVCNESCSHYRMHKELQSLRSQLTEKDERIRELERENGDVWVSMAELQKVLAKREADLATVREALERISDLFFVGLWMARDIARQALNKTGEKDENHKD